MRKVFFIGSLAALAFCFLSWISTRENERYKKKFRVTGCIMQTESYCGGANPPKEILEKAKTPAPIPFGKLYLRKSGKNEEGVKIIDTIHADAKGNFSINLPTGNYCLVEEWKAKPYALPLKDETQKVDSACYKKLYESCDYQITVTNKNLSGLKIVFNRPCPWNRPCIAYKGPLPPAAQMH